MLKRWLKAEDNDSPGIEVGIRLHDSTANFGIPSASLCSMLYDSSPTHFSLRFREYYAKDECLKRAAAEHCPDLERIKKKIDNKFDLSLAELPYNPFCVRKQT